MNIDPNETGLCNEEINGPSEDKAAQQLYEDSMAASLPLNIRVLKWAAANGGKWPKIVDDKGDVEQVLYVSNSGAIIVGCVDGRAEIWGPCDYWRIHTEPQPEKPKPLTKEEAKAHVRPLVSRFTSLIDRTDEIRGAADEALGDGILAIIDRIQVGPHPRIEKAIEWNEDEWQGLPPFSYEDVQKALSEVAAKFPLGGNPKMCRHRLLVIPNTMEIIVRPDPLKGGNDA